MLCDSCMEITVSSNGGAQEHQPNRFATLLRTNFVVKIYQILKYRSMLHKRYIHPFRKIISHKINWTLLKAGSVHKRWLSLGEHGSLLDCRQQTVRFLENPEIWFLLPSGTSRLIQCQTLWSTSSSGSSQRLLEASTEVRLKSCNSPKFSVFLWF